MSEVKRYEPVVCECGLGTHVKHEEDKAGSYVLYGDWEESEWRYKQLYEMAQADALARANLEDEVRNLRATLKRRTVAAWELIEAMTTYGDLEKWREAMAKLQITLKDQEAPRG